MSFTSVQARAFLSDSELDLFESSFGAGCTALAAPELARRLKSTRALRDKARDLLQRQTVATKEQTGTKGGASGNDNQRTAQKATALEEALTRYQSESDTRKNPAAEKTGTAPVAKAKKPAADSAPDAAPATSAAATLRAALAKKRAGADHRAASNGLSGGRYGAGASKFANAKPTAPATQAHAVAAQLEDSNLMQIQGHTSTQVRHSQAKHDSKA